MENSVDSYLAVPLFEDKSGLGLPCLPRFIDNVPGLFTIRATSSSTSAAMIRKL